MLHFDNPNDARKSLQQNTWILDEMSACLLLVLVSILSPVPAIEMHCSLSDGLNDGLIISTHPISDMRQ